MATVFDTAKYILERQGPLSPMKLQKLCYYAQAWSLVWNDRPLFEEKIQSWASGPVCPELFSFSRGRSSISAEEMQGDSGQLDPPQKRTVRSVLDFYGDEDAQWLSQLTIMEDPWRLARQGVSAGMSCQACVTKESMAIYYGGL